MPRKDESRHRRLETGFTTNVAGNDATFADAPERFSVLRSRASIYCSGDDYADV